MHIYNAYKIITKYEYEYEQLDIWLFFTYNYKTNIIYWNSLMLKFDCFQLFTINAFRITDELTNMKNRLYYQFRNIF